MENYHSTKKTNKITPTEKLNYLINYWNGLLEDYTLNEKGEEILKDLLIQFNLEEILFSIQNFIDEIPSNTSFDQRQKLLAELLPKLGGICYNRNLSPLERKKTHLAFYSKKKFDSLSKFNVKLIKMIFQQIFNKLKEKNWDDKEIINFSDTIIIPCLREYDDFVISHKKIMEFVEILS